MSHDLAEPGQVRMALAGDSPISGSGELLTMSFQMADPSAGGTRLLWTKGEINEGTVPVHLGSGQLGQLHVIHLPVVERRNGL